ncbi:hypothetical protein ACIQC7_34810 [Kitasatospora sp. NPDC088556]|uniref:hypothetical protein n=1 Tax=Kitasatospora sp. NPDC088556 TaxID=3364076 RepID=UPI00380C292F
MNTSTLDGPGTGSIPVAIYALSATEERPALQLEDCRMTAVARGLKSVLAHEYWDKCPPYGRPRLGLGERWGDALRAAESGLVAGIVVHNIMAVVLDQDLLEGLTSWADENSVLLHFVHGQPFGGPHHQIGRLPQKSLA